MTVSSPVELQGLIDDSLIEPIYSIDDPILLDAVAAECLEPFAGTEGDAFAIAELEPLDGPQQVVVIYFADDGSIQALDAGDCTTIG